jgi:hypothetical protein
MTTLLTFAASVVASTGIATLVMNFIVESALKSAQEKKKVEQERRERRYKLDDEWQHDVSQVLLWVHHGIRLHEKAEQKEFWNGELEQAMEEMNNTEKKRKELDRDQLAQANE